MKKGFTLVELSIVLVIIGLLIGGILVGQSLIESAEVTNYVRKVQQLDIMVNNFKTKYNKLPGDSTTMTPVGNGDGLIQTLPGNVAMWGDSTINSWNGEISNFYVHLFRGGMINDGKNYTETLSGSTLTFCGSNNPNGLAFPYRHETVARKCTGLVAYGVGNKNYYQAIGIASVGGTGWNNNTGPFSCYQAQMIDSKMDDGKRDVGAMIGRRPYGQLNLPISGLCNHTGVDDPNAGYGTLKTPLGGHLVAVRIDILAQAGGN